MAVVAVTAVAELALAIVEAVVVTGGGSTGSSGGSDGGGCGSESCSG